MAAFSTAGDEGDTQRFVLCAAAVRRVTARTETAIMHVVHTQVYKLSQAERELLCGVEWIIPHAKHHTSTQGGQGGHTKQPRPSACGCSGSGAWFLGRTTHRDGGFRARFN